MADPNQQDEESRSPTLGERFDNFFKKNPVPVLLISLASVVTAIRNLRAGYTFEKFERFIRHSS